MPLAGQTYSNFLQAITQWSNLSQFVSFLHNTIRPGSEGGFLHREWCENDANETHCIDLLLFDQNRLIVASTRVPNEGFPQSLSEAKIQISLHPMRDRRLVNVTFDDYGFFAGSTRFKGSHYTFQLSDGYELKLDLPNRFAQSPSEFETAINFLMHGA